MALDTSDPEIKKALDEIKANNSSNEWVIIGHVGTTNKTKVVELGSGFDDMKDLLSGGKFLYVYYRFIINGFPKFVFMSWSPSGIQDQIFKGKTGGYLKDMEKFMKGYYHAQVNARNEDDVDEAEFRKKLVTATGASYTQSSNKKDLTVEQAKTNVTGKKEVEIKRTDEGKIDKDASSKFWEEENRRKEEFEKQNKKGPTASGVTDIKDNREKFWSQQQEEKKETSTVSGRAARQEELSSMSNKSKDYWANNSKPAPPTSSGSSAKEGYTVQSDDARASNLRNKFEQMKVKEETPAPKPVAPKKTFPPPKPVVQQEEEEEEPVQQQYEEPAPSYTEPEQPAYEESYPQQEEEPQQQYYQEETPQEEAPVEEEYVPPVTSIAAKKGLPPPVPPALPGKLAVALYDFASEDGEELPFNEGDHIYVIREEGDWFFAEDQNGRQGFIPGNYVEYK